MKKNVLVRVLTVLGGAALLAAGGCLAAEGFFGVPVSGWMAQLLASGHALAVLAKLVLIIGLLVLAGAAILCAMPRRRKEQDGFVMQRGENGAIGISVKAIEKQVRACIAKHDVIADADVAIRECRDGLIILLNVDQVAGVNIPLSVGLLQRQIKQYVSGCTGVDVHEVRVMVENNTTNVVASPFAVQDAEIPQARPVEEARVTAEPAPAPQAVQVEAPVEAPVHVAVPAAPVVLPEIPPMPAVPETSVEEDERPLHQRIFGTEEQPVFVPAPPEMLAEAANEPEAETNQEQAAEDDAELMIEADVDAASEAVLPLEAAEAGAAYSEALWTDEIPGEAEAEENGEEAAKDAEEEQPLL